MNRCMSAAVMLFCGGITEFNIGIPRYVQYAAFTPTH